MGEDTLLTPQSEIKHSIPSFQDYEPLLLEKEDLKKIVILLFNVNPEETTGEALSFRMVEDRDIVREKYSLPDFEMWRQNPSEYYRQLELLAKEAGVTIRTKEEFEQFFKERPSTAVYLVKSEAIVMNEMHDKDDYRTVLKKSSDFEHEFIHVLQSKKYPRMSLVQWEYEAYLANANVDFLQKTPWLFLERIALSLKVEQVETVWNDYLREKKVFQTDASRS